MHISKIVSAVSGLLFTLSMSGSCQVAGLASAGARLAHPGFAQRGPVNLSEIPRGSSMDALVFDAVTGKAIAGAPGKALQTESMLAVAPREGDAFGVSNELPDTSNIDGLNTLATFDGAFIGQGGPSLGADFRFTMIGNDPRLGGTTVIPTNIAENSLDLLSPDGQVFKGVPYAPFSEDTVKSPDFAYLNYGSGNAIEYADAIHRAEFYNVMKGDWHTVLTPKIVDHVKLAIPYSVKVQLSNGDIITARSYFTGTAPDGSTYVLMLDLLFDYLFGTEVNDEINAGNFNTNGINATMFPNTFLFSLNVANPNTPGGCCTLGFHTYFYNPSTLPQPRWITEYASWISPGLFGGGFEDVTALSHETTESFADPFIDNPTPNWQFPGQPSNSMVCQNNLEEGDPVEVLANATYPIEVKQKDFDFVYHPQNLALFEWFEMGAKSNAIDGAFSYPNETVLTQSAIPCPQ